MVGVWCALSDVWCVLRGCRWSLCVVCCLLFVDEGCWLFAVCDLLSVVCCVLFVVCSVLCVVCAVLCRVCYSLCVVC